MASQPPLSPLPPPPSTATSAYAPPPHPVAAAPTIASFFAKYADQYVVPAHLAPAALQICITAFPLGLLAGLVLPRALRFLLSDWFSVLPLSSFSSSSSATAAAEPWYTLPQLHIYLLAWSLFHLLEFVITAAYNPTRLYSDSFLLNNGIAYHIAHVAGLVEFALTAAFVGGAGSIYKRPGIVTLVGILLVVAGQAIRSLAMIHAHNNFSHIVAHQKRQDHQLVKTGVYSFTRHPSYFGFFYWALGTQILLGNVVGCIAFAVVLWRFFSRRIEYEEKHLIKFFKDEYIQYKKDVATRLPFIP
ncbi:farnesyl cysteine-carboxyl methyltransferase [Thecaphora frezii]